MTERNLRHIIHPFSPIISEKCTVLILGSVPSVKSVENGFFYMHPQNRFWNVLGAVLKENLTGASNEEKREKLLKHKIALFDTVYECDIAGSSDSAVKNIVPSNIPALIEKTEIKRIFCSGALAYKLLLKYFPQYKNISAQLPSTSPRNATFSESRLIEEWKKIKEIDD